VRTPSGSRTITRLSPLGELISGDLNGPLLKFRASGTFTATIRLTALDAAPLIAEIERMMETVADVTGSLDISCPFDPQDDSSYYFTFSKPARTISSAGRVLRRAPGLWDAKSRKLAKHHKIPLGSSVRVSYGFNHSYRADSPGVSLEMLGVQTATII
jgi:hypothetical protein